MKDKGITNLSTDNDVDSIANLSEEDLADQMLEEKGIAEPVTTYAVEGKQPAAEQITGLKESEEERQRRLQEAIPPHLREKINAARSTIEGERKMVTMLYSDLSGFTALSEKYKDNPGKMAELIAFPSNPTVWVQLKGGEWQRTNENKKYTLKEEDNRLDVYDNRWIAVKDVGEINRAIASKI